MGPEPACDRSCIRYLAPDEITADAGRTSIGSRKTLIARNAKHRFRHNATLRDSSLKPPRISQDHPAFIGAVCQASSDSVGGSLAAFPFDRIKRLQLKDKTIARPAPLISATQSQKSHVRRGTKDWVTSSTMP